MDYDEYIKRRDELLGIRMDSFRSFDKAILSLSTGSLALSITFLDRIGKPFSRATFTLIAFAWVLFFLVIVFNLGSYYFARANMDRKIAELDARYQRELDSKIPDTSPEAVFWHNRATSFCNTGAFITFVAGVLFFVLYIITIQTNNYAKLNSAITQGESDARREATIDRRKDGIPESGVPPDPQDRPAGQ